MYFDKLTRQYQLSKTLRFSLIPQGKTSENIRKERIIEIDMALLEKLGIKGIIVDLDNTLGGYDDELPPADVVEWMKGIRGAGYKVYLVSNNSHKTRASAYSERLGIPFKNLSLKPLPFKIISAIKEMGCRREEVILIGDQVRTDYFGARLAGTKIALVTPIVRLKKRGVL